MQVERLGSYRKQIRSKLQTQLYATKVFLLKKMIRRSILILQPFEPGGHQLGFGGVVSGCNSKHSKWLFRHRFTTQALFC